MEDDRARELLAAERKRVEKLLGETGAAGQQDRVEADEPGDLTDSAPALTNQEEADAVVESLRQRLAAIGRAEQRLAEGDFGRSVRSGVSIPDDRLEADPAAELTVGEASEV